MRTIVAVTYIISFLWPLPMNNSERILAFICAPFYSHHMVHQSLLSALHKRGHELIVVTPFPTKNETLRKMENYTEIDGSSVISAISDYNNNRWEISEMESCKKAYAATDKITTMTLNLPEIKKLYEDDNDQKIDAIIIEALGDLSLYTLAHWLNVPFIGEFNKGHRIPYSLRETFALSMLCRKPNVRWDVTGRTEPKDLRS